jgi:hypothetical protein
MIYIVNAYDKISRKYVPHIVSFIRESDSEEPIINNYFLKSETMNYEDVEFCIVKNLTKDQEQEYENNLNIEMNKNAE